MHLPIPSSRYSIKPFHHHPHILLQCIFAEMIAAFKELRAIDLLLETPERAAKDEYFNQLAKHLYALSGTKFSYASLLQRQEESSLEKLKNYTALFAHMAGYIDQERNKMHESIKSAISYNFEVLEMMKYLPAPCTPEDMQQVIDRIKKMRRAIFKMANLLDEVMPQFRYNENVLFFILRHHMQLDAIYDNFFVRKTLSKFFSRNLDKASDFLVSKYQARGFNHIIPLVKQYIKAIKTKP